MVDVDGYDRLELLGQGGFAVVYRAYQPSLDRYVALKVFLTEIDDSAGRERFDREIRLLARVSDHPNIVSVLDSGFTRDGHPYLSMPLYTRGTLAGLLAEHGPLAYEGVLRIGVKLASALTTLHDSGIVHGDIKPQNVLLNTYGEVALSDFGMARVIQSDEGEIGDLGFTPAYAPPEALEGRHVGPPGDVYGLASTLYTCRTGLQLRPDPGGSLLEAMQELPGSEPALSESIEPALRMTLKRALATSPQVRPTAAGLAADLQGQQRSAGFVMTEMSLRQPGPSADRTPAPHAQEITLSPATNSAPSAPSSQAAGSVQRVESPTQAPASGWSDTVVRPDPRLADRLAPPTQGRRKFRLRWTRPTRFGISLAKRMVAALSPLLVIRHHGTQGVESGHLPTKSDSLEYLTSDRPTARDRLGQAPIVTGLARLLNDPGTGLPLTIGIAGRWGSGKTSLMMQLESELHSARERDQGNRRWLPVWFEAWRFQGREALWAGLTRAIYEQGKAQLHPWPRRVWFRLLLEYRRRGTVRFIGACLVGITGLAFLGYQVGRADSGANGWSLVARSAAAFAAAATAASYIGLIAEPFNKAVARGSITKRYDEFLGISDAAEQDVNHLVRVLSRCSGRANILVYLDDLDRCQPSTISEALAAVTNIFGREEGDPIAFILGVDIDMVAGAVDETFRPVRESMLRTNPRRAMDLAGNFLERVFQLTVSLDTLRRVPVEQLLDPDAPAMVNDVDDASFAVALREMSIVSPWNLTRTRHAAGIVSVDLSGERLLALRRAVRDRRADLLTSRSADVRAAQTRVIRHMHLTPRAAKRFDTAYRLQLQVANGTPGSELTFHPNELTALAKWVALRCFFPSLSRSVDRQPGLWQELEQIASSDGAPLQLREKLSQLAPDLEGALCIELGELLAMSLPEASLGALPMDTFITIL